MGFWGNLINGKKKPAPAGKLVYSPLKGQVIPLSEVGDPVFAEGMMGPGVGILPEEGKLYAPVNGTVTVAFPTGHAVALRSEDGMDVLIHIGLDTVKLNGEGFQMHTSEGAQVKAGDLLVSFDIRKITEAGYPVTTMVLVSNADEVGTMSDTASGDIQVMEKLYTFV